MKRSRERLVWLVLAGAAGLSLFVGLTLSRSGGPRVAIAQETELPSVPLDSVEGDFLPPTPPNPRAAPSPPHPPSLPSGMSREELDRKYHIKAGANDVVQVGEDIVIEPGQHVLGHVFAMGGNVTVRGMVDDDVVAMGGDVDIEAGATVRGDAVSIGGSVRKDPGATVLGSTVSVGAFPRGFMALQALNFVGEGVKLLAKVFALAFWLFIAWIVIMLSRARSARVVARIEEQPLPSIGWGLLASLAVAPAAIAVAFVAVLLVVTIIGIPIAVLVLLGFAFGIAVLCLWGAIVGSAAVGVWLVRRLAPRLGPPSLMRHTLIGVLAVGAPGVLGHLFKSLGVAVPPAMLVGGMLGVLGFLLLAGSIWAGMGAILTSRAGQPAPLPGTLGGPGPSYATPVPPAGPMSPAAPPQGTMPGTAQPAP